MTSPTKTKLCKENPDWKILKEINTNLYENIQSCLDFIVTAQVKDFKETPSNLRYVYLSRELIGEIDKLESNAKAKQIQESLHKWQTELLFHVERLVPEIQKQPGSTIINFIENGFGVSLIEPYPVTPRKSARLQARKNSSTTHKESEAEPDSTTELPRKRSVNRVLFSFEKSNAPAEPKSESITVKVKNGPGLG